MRGSLEDEFDVHGEFLRVRSGPENCSYSTRAEEYKIQRVSAATLRIRAAPCHLPCLFLPSSIFTLSYFRVFFGIL